MNDVKIPEISVVIPLYQAEDCAQELYTLLKQVLSAMNVSYEILFIDDYSKDGSWQKVLEISRQDSQVKTFRLSRNFGQHYTISAGLHLAKGRWIVVMDCDLQDPPESIPQLYQKAQEGYDIVYARRNNRKDGLFKKLFAWFYHKIISSEVSHSIDSSTGTFTLLSRKVVDAFLKLKCYHRHYLILLRWLGFQSAYVDAEHCPRYAGHSSYNLSKLISLALDGIISQTNLLLRGISSLGIMTMFFSAIYILYIIYLKFTHPTVPVGYSSIMAIILLFGGFTLLSIGIIGIYIKKYWFKHKNGLYSSSAK